MTLPTRALGTSGLSAGVDRPRLHELQRHLRRLRGPRPRRGHRPGARPRGHPARHGRRLRPARVRGGRRARHPGPTGRGGAGHEVRAAAPGRLRRRPASAWSSTAAPPTPVECIDGSLRPPRRRPHRPLLPPPSRHRGPDRGDDRGDGRDGRRRQGPPPRPVRGVGRHDPPGQWPSTRSPRSRPSTRSGAATSRRRSSPRAASSGIGLVPYSPLGRGLLTGTIGGTDDLAARDFRRVQPRFAEGAIDDSLAAVEVVRGIADAHGVTPGQVALAWVLAQGDDVVPDPRHQAGGLPRGERRGGRPRAHGRGPRHARPHPGQHPPVGRRGLDQPEHPGPLVVTAAPHRGPSPANERSDDPRGRPWAPLVTPAPVSRRTPPKWTCASTWGVSSTAPRGWR